MLEDHNIPQLIGICGIVISYLFAIVFNALNGIGGKRLFNLRGHCPPFGSYLGVWHTIAQNINLLPSKLS